MSIDYIMDCYTNLKMNNLNPINYKYVLIHEVHKDKIIADAIVKQSKFLHNMPNPERRHSILCQGISFIFTKDTRFNEIEFLEVLFINNN